MYGSYYDKEFILVDRFSTLEIWDYKKQNVKRWDVVVVKPEVDKNKEFFIKRVVWLPNEELKIEKWNVYLKKNWEEEFTKLDEKYLNKENYWNTKIRWDSIIYKIPEWKYFVMWDNRNHSSDSRSCFSYNCSTIDRDNYIWKDFIVWKVLVDFGYFNLSEFNFTHPVIKENWEYISTKPKWVSSADSYSY
jgi:signal peptidase I